MKTNIEIFDDASENCDCEFECTCGIDESDEDSVVAYVWPKEKVEAKAKLLIEHTKHWASAITIVNQIMKPVCIESADFDFCDQVIEEIKRINLEEYYNE